MGNESIPNGNNQRVTLGVLGAKLDLLHEATQARLDKMEKGFQHQAESCRACMDRIERKADANENDIIRLKGRMETQGIIHYIVSFVGSALAALIGVKVK